MEQTTRFFSRSMGRWLMTLMLVMLSSLATRAAEIYVRMGNVQGSPGERVTVPIYVDCDVDMRAFEMYFSTDLGVCFSGGEFSDRVDPSSYNGFNINSGCIVAVGLTGSDDVALEAGNGLVAEAYLDIPDDAQPGAYTMFLSDIAFIPTGGAGSTIYLNDVTATLTVIVGAPEAYACYTPSNTTLTFYFDNLRSTRTGKTYDMNTDYSAPRWVSDGISANITKAVITPSFADARPTSTHSWFSGMKNLQSITGMEYLNTNEVTDMAGMFVDCYVLQSLDVSSFNTSKVTDMEYMFDHMNALTSLDLINFNTSMVTNMHAMFWDCEALTSVDVSSFNTSNVTDMSLMFSQCNKLTSVDLSSFNTSKVTKMNRMFESCYRLTSLNLSSFNTSKVTYMSWMFFSCDKLKTIYVGNGWSRGAVTDSDDMFHYCTSLEGGQGTTFDENHVDAAYAHVDGGPSYPGYLTRDPNVPEPYACYTPASTTLTFYCDKLRSSRPGTTYDLNEDDNEPGWYTDGTNDNVTKVVFHSSFANALPTSTLQWFGMMSNLRSITGITYLNTENVATMSSMFLNCSSLTSLDLSGFNTAHVANMGDMFYGCTGLTSLDLSGFNTANVTNMAAMFYGCTGLRNLDLFGFNTAHVSSMRNMFYDCSGLTSLDLSDFNTSEVTDMGWMFAGFSGLTSLDLSNFNTANVTNMKHMFRGCNNLTTILAGCAWSTAAVTDSERMFYNCTSLVGGQGTTYSSSHVDAAYAHIDGGSSNPGYFTAITEAYACYTPSNTTLTFYYDDLYYTRPGTTYSLVDGMPEWYNDLLDLNISSLPMTRVAFDPSFAGARPTSTYAWFANMSNLQSITGMEYLNTSEVIDMYAMFYECSGLTTLDLSNFNTANVVNMCAMFYYCNGLTTLDLSSFNTAKVIDMSGMFLGCESLTTIYAGSGWSTDGLNSLDDSYRMFYVCTSLVGGMGTTYDENYMDAARAHIDGGPSNPGYFTAKSSFLRGDVNGDGQVKIGDVTALINYLLSHDASGVNLDAADTNQNGGINISDVTALVNYLLSGSW